MPAIAVNDLAVTFFAVASRLSAAPDAAGGRAIEQWRNAIDVDPHCFLALAYRMESHGVHGGLTTILS